MLPLTIVSLNSYLILRQLNKNSHQLTHTEQRAFRIRNFVRDKHLCFLQEVWGSSLDDLRDSHAHQTSFDVRQGLSHYLPSSTASILKDWLPQFALDMFHSLRLYGHGGLYDLSSTSPPCATTNRDDDGGHGIEKAVIQCLYRSKHTFTVSRTLSQKGVEVTLWTIPQWGPQYQLLVFNTHLDASKEGAEFRIQQVDEILRFMQATLDHLDSSVMVTENHEDSVWCGAIAKSSTTENTELQPKKHHQAKVGRWSTTGVLVLGDFNVKASSKEYQDLLQSDKGEARWEDYFGNNYGSDDESTDHRLIHKHTYSAENSFVPVNNYEDCGRIDYIFGIPKFGKYTFMSLECVSRSIPIQKHGEELSDHYPLVLQLVPKGEYRR